jgi:hypothetical protein
MRRVGEADRRKVRIPHSEKRRRGKLFCFCWEWGGRASKDQVFINNIFQVVTYHLLLLSF